MRHGSTRKTPRPHIDADQGGNTNRMQRLRDRRRCHRHTVRIEYPAALPLALADSGFLASWDSENPTAVGKAIEDVLIAMCKSAGYDVTSSDDELE